MTDDDTPWPACCALTLGTHSESIGLGSHIVTRCVSVLDTPATEMLSNALRVRVPMTHDSAARREVTAVPPHRFTVDTSEPGRAR